MPISRRRVVAAIAGSVAGWGAAPLLAQVQERPLESRFRAIAQQPTPPGGVIEVIDFFWYGCPFCYQLLPLLEAWEKTKPADVTVRRIPVILRENWLADAHLYYTLDVLGQADRLHGAVFQAMHRDRIQSTDSEAWGRWATANGIEREKWEEAYFKSKVVRERVIRAVDLGRDYDIRGTPAVVVDGRYQTGSGIAGSVQNVMPTVDELVALVRERRAKG